MKRTYHCTLEETDLKKRLDLLEQLQQIDLMVDVLKANQCALQAELNGITQSLESARDNVAGLKSRAAQVEMEKSELENNNKVELENIHRSETNMKEIKTNKEYQAVGREIAAARKQVAELEEQILQKISLLDELNNEIVGSEAKLTELEENTELRRSEKQGEIDKVQQDIDVDSLRRDTITKELPANIVKRYDSLRGQRRGQAVAVAKDGYCLGCNMHLPPQLYNSLFRFDELISCPHCQRMLVLQQPSAQ